MSDDNNKHLAKEALEAVAPLVGVVMDAAKPVFDALFLIGEDAIMQMAFAYEAGENAFEINNNAAVFIITGQKNVQLFCDVAAAAKRASNDDNA